MQMLPQQVLNSVLDSPHGQDSGPSPGNTSPPVSQVSPQVSPLREGSMGSVASQLTASNQNLSPEKVEEMITLYHITNSPSWGKSVADAKGKGVGHEDFGKRLNPDLTYEKRKANPDSGERNGDDVGPGFYTGTSAKFAEQYMKENFSFPNDPGGLLTFQLPKSALEGLNGKHNAPDDVGAFQQNMKDGFESSCPETGERFPPRLDVPQNQRQHDVVSGPINDVHAKTNPTVQGDGCMYSSGNILKYGNEVPLQYAFATNKGCQTLYDKSNSISYSGSSEWLKEREKQAKLAPKENN